MSIKKQIAFLIIGIFFANISFSQREKIDSLKKILPLLKDSARVDCLNALSESILNSRNVDTASYYTALAYEEARKLKYIQGIAEALSYKGRIEVISDNFSAAEKLFRQSISWYRKTLNKKKLATSYAGLGYSLFAQSNFQDAIKNLDTCIKLSTQLEDSLNIWRSLNISTEIYHESGDNEKAFEKLSELHRFLSKHSNTRWKALELTKIGESYKYIEDYPAALKYFTQAYQITKPDNYDLLHLGEILSLNKKFDSADYYYSRVDTGDDKRILRFYLFAIGENYFAQNQYNNALKNFLRSLPYHQQSADHNPEMQTLLSIAKTYLALGNNEFAFKYAREALAMATQTDARQNIRDAYKILSAVYDYWHQSDSAYFYYKQYTILNDSVVNERVKGKLAAYSFEEKIELLNKEKEIQQIELQKQSFLKNILIGGIIILLLLAAIIVRNIALRRRNEAHRRELVENELQFQKLESEKSKAELRHQATKLEMQALRAQMNPHFIFNCLSSINGFILKNESESASDYLTKFSRLIRMVLTNSKKSFITLEDELEMLRIYLEMERLRFQYSFDYHIRFKNEIDPENIFIPSLLLQPFAENAIWHGLMHKEGNGYLEIALSPEEKILICTITDNGIGRYKAAQIKSKSAAKQKSMGLQITAERLALLNQDRNVQTSFDIEDITDDRGKAAGTKVTLRMHYRDLTEMIA
jgi:tetratricopeptide (TPR) repeat protein